ncbi:SusC/RagA family TonB-linked outer membrane protein [Pedobacter sp. MC2016-14]|uniref:SusC/RagA family TonB-linked outer membrane protein n=1 Tax=Pedobacter sp. MC2016-14 TaxID=2897327 RepID=UPI001E2C2C4B|nr:SusC/RagA family TonB-linked outer membrane protein [Pedobacter sp. MC2016-14]MCD0490407.1 SusC/RagA family TonB-linked outer membrane protein [Pedobacter sp. MC2016-14]
MMKTYICSICFMAVALFLLTPQVKAQQIKPVKVDVDFNNISLKQALDQLQKKSNYNFVFSEEMISPYKVTLKAKSMSVEAVMDKLLSKTSLDFVVRENKIIIRKRATTTQVPSTTMPKSVPATSVKGPQKILGRVVDEGRQPIPGAGITILGNPRNSTVTNSSGEFMLTAEDNDETLVITSVGFTRQEINLKQKISLPFVVVLKPFADDLNEVVVTGYSRRTKDSFTGSASTFTGEDLKRVGNKNILQSLQNLDPSFVLTENLSLGSNPNVLPDIQLRGQAGLEDVRGDYSGNPNLPLFILDGFEANLQKIYDLDMNRVASITILRDASAKAIYGSKAANGVLVIETLAPQEGKLRITYNSNYNIEAPDLTSYHLTNASEKLQVERNAGRYTSPSPLTQQFLTEQANLIEADIARGVNTYWLSKPLRVGLGMKHGFYLEGGDQSMRYGIDLNYNNLTGVMKESKRDNIGGSINLSYRSGKLIFRNILNINLNKSINSPYGTFSEYTRLNPYWAPTDEYGRINKVLGEFRSSGTAPPTYYYNPLYNATLNTKNFSNYTEVTENFYTEWQPAKSLKITGRVGFTQNRTDSELFYPGDHTRFIEMTGENFYRRGTYNITDGKTTTLNSDVFANWTKMWGKNLVLINGGANLGSTQGQTHGMAAEGFLNNRVDFISFASQYALNGVPSGTENIQREIGLLAFGSYAYDNRYLLDVSARRNASSVFGANNRWGTFLSVGVGWNLHHEDFIKKLNIFDMLKIRASIGSTGSQNFNPYQALATYTFFTSSTYDNISGAYLSALANDNLRWQEKIDNNIGLDINLLKRLNIRLDYYVANTNNLLTDLTLPPSTGFTTYKENLGSMRNIGYEGTVSYQLYRNAKTQSYVSVFGSFARNSNKITKISDGLKQLNKEQDELADASNRPVTRFEEGQSMSSIWAVPSLGIDPATGDEIYVKKDGSTTYVWDPNDQIVAGITDPLLRGNFGLNLEYKGWGLSGTFRYTIGEDYYNSTLASRVENVDIANNVDTRVFNNTWLNIGDKVPFKRISTRPTQTRATTRFIENKSDLTLSSVNAYYDFKWKNLKRFGLKNLKCSILMNEVFVLSTVRIERGTEYPFARTFSFSLQTTF